MCFENINWSIGLIWEGLNMYIKCKVSILFLFEGCVEYIRIEDLEIWGVKFVFNLILFFSYVLKWCFMLNIVIVNYCLIFIGVFVLFRRRGVVFWIL